MSDIKIQGVVEMSSEGAERSFDRLGQKADEMSRKVTQTSAQAGQAVDQIGNGASRNADEFTRSEKRIVDSIKRATTELQNLGKTASQKLELRIDTKGLERAKFEPLLANLRELEAAQMRVATSGRSFAGGLQNTSYQLQDFIVQVNGGTDATRALAMQLPQMLVGFGAAGAAIGVVAALLPNMISLFGGAADEAASLKDAMSSMDDAISQVGRTVRTFDMEGLYEEFNAASDATRAATIEQLNFQRAFIETQRLVSQKAFSESLSGIGDFGFLDKLSGGGTAASRVADDLGVTLDVAERLAPVLKGLRDGTEDVGSAFTRFGTQLLSGNKDAVALATAMRDLANGEKDAYAASSALSEALERMAKGHVRTKKETDEAAKASKAYADETQRMAEAARELVASLLGQSSGLSADFFKKWETLGKAYKAGAISLQDLTDAQAVLLAQQPAMKRAAKDAEGYGKALASTVGALEDRALALETELANYGLTKAEIERTTIARLEEVRAMAAANGATDEYLRNVDREIEARKRIASATAGIEAADANRKAADDAAKEWQRTADNIEKALVDALMEGGKSGKEYIEGLFRTMVLRPIVQAIVQPVAGSITSAMWFGQPVASGGGSFGLPPGIGTAGIVSSGLQWAGAALGSSAIGSFGAGMAMTSSQIAGLSGAGLISGGAATAGATVAAAMPYIGAALFAAQALGLFDKKPSDKTSSATFDLGKNAVTETWDMGGKKAASQEQKDANVALSLLVGSFAKDAGLTGQILTAMGGRDGTRLAIDGGFRTPTGEAAGGVWLGDETAYSYGNGEDAIKRMLDDLIDEGTLPQATIDAWRSIKTDMLGVARDATELVSTLNLLTQGYDTATIERANLLQTEGEALETALARMQSLEAALSGTALPGDALAQSVGAIIRQFDELAQAVPLSVESLGSVIDGLDLTTAEGRKTYQSLMALAPAFVEIQKAQTALYDQLYTDEQRAANLAVEVGDAFAQLGLTLPTTRDEMRALIDAQDGTTESGAKLKAQLLGLVPAFVSVSDAAQQAAQVAIDAARDALKKQFDGVESVLKAEIARFGTEMSGLQSALNRAAEAERNRLNAAADAERTAISDQIAALSDVGGAYESATDAIRGASSALRNAVDRLRGIERIDRLQYDQAVAQIDVMTVLARAGVMPDQDRLQSAIGTITSADSSRYASSFEMEREQLRRAGQLETLDSIITSNAAYQDAAAERDRAAAEAQMDLLKAQLAAVDAQLEGDLKRLAAMEASGKAQLNALLGVDDSVVSMDAAMRAIGEATAKYEKDHLKLLERDLDAAERYHAQSLSGIAQVVAAGTQQAGLLLSVDYNIKQLAAQMSAVGAALVAAAQKDEVPAFASGGLHTGGIRLVGERGPELEVTGPARIWSAEDTRRMLSGGADAGTADEIRALRQEQQAQARAQVALEARMVKLLERWERDGMPTTRLELA